jgi:hypothetical protein
MESERSIMKEGLNGMEGRCRDMEKLYLEEK